MKRFYTNKALAIYYVKATVYRKDDGKRYDEMIAISHFAMNIYSFYERHKNLDGLTDIDYKVKPTLEMILKYGQKKAVRNQRYFDWLKLSPDELFDFDKKQSYEDGTEFFEDPFDDNY